MLQLTGYKGLLSLSGFICTDMTYEQRTLCTFNQLWQCLKQVPRELYNICDTHQHIRPVQGGLQARRLEQVHENTQWKVEQLLTENVRLRHLLACTETSKEQPHCLSTSPPPYPSAAHMLSSRGSALPCRQVKEFLDEDRASSGAHSDSDSENVVAVFASFMTSPFIPSLATTSGWMAACHATRLKAHMAIEQTL